MNTIKSRTTVSISRTTKERLDRWRAADQCYDSFICQLVGLWEKTHDNNREYERLRVSGKQASTLIDR